MSSVLNSKLANKVKNSLRTETYKLWSTFYLTQAYLRTLVKTYMLIPHKRTDYVQTVSYVFGLSSPSWRRHTLALSHTHTYTHTHTHIHILSISLSPFALSLSSMNNNQSLNSYLRDKAFVAILGINHEDLPQIYVRLIVKSISFLSRY